MKITKTIIEYNGLDIHVSGMVYNEAECELSYLGIEDMELTSDEIKEVTELAEEALIEKRYSQDCYDKFSGDICL